MDDLFARVRPVIGDALDNCQVAVAGSAAAATLVDYLAACGVRRWLVWEGNDWIEGVATKVRARFGDTLGFSYRLVASLDELAAAHLALAVDAAEVAQQLPTTLPRLAICTPTGNGVSNAFWAMPGEALPVAEAGDGFSADSWDWLTAAPLMAMLARALLLQGSAYRMRTWDEAFARGRRSYQVGTAHDPTVSAWQRETAQRQTTLYRTAQHRQGTLLIVGLGSLGSVTATHLAPQVDRMVLVDPDRIERSNLVRQAYGAHEVGQPKAEALARSLRAAYPGMRCATVVDALVDETQAAELIRAHGVTAALVTTGTQADFAISRALRAAGIVHLVGRCYARARFWEGIVVDGAAGASYEQVRREVAAGPAAAPTPEEIAAYGVPDELVGEPATAMETGWAALWLARLMAQMMAPDGLREGWLLARLAAGATCFIGGVEVEPSEGGPAYGVQTPGQIHAWSIEQIKR